MIVGPKNVEINTYDTQIVKCIYEDREICKTICKIIMYGVSRFLGSLIRSIYD